MWKAALEEPKTASGQVQETKNSINALKQSFGELAYQVLAPFLKIIQSVANYFKEMSPEVKKLLVYVATIPASIAGVMIALYPFTTALQYAVGAVKTLGTGLLFLIRHPLPSLAQTAAAAKVALAALAVYGIYKLSEAIYNANPFIQKFNEELAKTTILSYKLATIQGKAFKDTMRYASGLDDPTAVRYLEEKLRVLKQTQDAQEKIVKGNQKQALASAPKWEDSIIKYLAGNKDTALYVQQVKEAQEALGKTGEAIAEVEGEITRRNANLTPDQKLKVDMEDFIKSLKLQAATLGMTAEQAKAYQFQLLATHPALQALVRDMGVTVQEFMKMKAVFDANTSLGQLNDKLREDIFYFGKSADEITIWKLALANANPAAIRFAQGLLEIKKGLEYQKKLMEDAKRVTEKFITPQEKFNKTWRELWEMRRWGKMGWDTYDRAMGDAKKEMDEAMHIKIRFSNDPVSLKGSAEQARNWWDMMQNRVLGPAKKQWGMAPGGGPMMMPGVVPTGQDVDKSMSEMAQGIGRLVQLAEMQAGRQPALMIQPAAFQG
jgi:hypothetical protein